MPDFTTMSEEELHNEFVARSRAGESLQPIFVEQHRRRNLGEALMLAEGIIGRAERLEEHIGGEQSKRP